MPFFENSEQIVLDKVYPDEYRGSNNNNSTKEDYSSSESDVTSDESRSSRQHSNSKIRTFFLYLTTGVVILVGAAIFYFNFAKGTEAVWYNDEYAYRQIFSFTHDADISTERAITFSLDTAELIAAGVMQLDCDDTRFTNLNGKLLRYQLTGTCDNAATTYEVVFPSIINGTNIGYVYYGNPSATSASVDVSSVTALTPSGGDPSITTRTNEVKGPSPVLYWKLNDGTGTNAQDSTSQNNDGTTSGPTWEVGGVAAAKGEFSLKFDGSNDLVSKSYSTDTELNPGTANMSVSAWFRHSSTISGTDTLISRGSGTLESEVGYKLYMNSSGYICFGIDDTAGSFPADSACSTATQGSYADSKWHFVEGVKSGTSSITLYIDGVQIAQDASLLATLTISGSSPTFYVGIDSDGTSNPWTGFIDEVKVFTSEQSARSAAQAKVDFVSRSSEVSATVLGQDTAQTNLVNGLVGWWKMDDSGVDAEGETSTDSSGNSNTGTLYGDNGVGDNGTGLDCTASGKFGTGCNLDGTDDYVSTSNGNSVKGLSQVTIAAWLNLSGSGERIIYTEPINSGQSIRFRLEITSGNKLNLTGRAPDSGSAVSWSTGNSTLSTGTLYHVVAVYDAVSDSVSLYLNGNLDINSANTLDPFDNTNPFSVPKIGTNAAADASFFNGTIDEVRIYNRALSPVEVSRLYNWAPGPVGYWKMDEGSGTDANDSSGNSNTGTLTNSPSWSQGKFGSAVSFAGGNQHIIRADDSDFDFADDADVTLTTWFKHTTASAQEIILSKYNEAGYKIIMEADGDITCALDYDGTWTPTDSATSTAATYDDNNWHHVACVKIGASSLNLYIDGILITTNSSITATNTLTNSDPLYLGIDADATSNDFTGSLDDVKIYNYARTPGQIVEDMNASHPAPGSPVGSPVGYWKIDEGYGTNVNDTSENNNDLTMSTASWTNSGKFGKAWNGDGTIWMSRSNDADLDFSATEDFTISGWFKSDSSTNPANGIEYLLATTTGNTDAGYAIYANTNGTICFGIDDDTTWGPDVSSCSASDFYDGNWHHVVAVRNVTTDTTKIYIDALEKDSDTDTTTATLDGDNVFYLGDFDGDNNATTGIEEFAGDIDEVKIFRLALTADQVKTDFNRGQAVVYGALSTESGGVVASDSYSREFCIPGDTSTCNPPVADWKMEEGTGTTTNDSSGNANISSAFTGDVAWTNAKIGKGLSFDGTNDVVQFVETTSTDLGATTDSYTVSAWAKTSVSCSGNPCVIVHKFDGSGSAVAYSIYFNTSNQICFDIQDTGAVNPKACVSGTSYQNGTWHYFTGIRDVATDKVYLYVDGVFATSSTDTTTATAANDDNLSFGNSGTSYTTFDFNGQIDEVKIYNYARTPAQIAWDYNRGKPVGWWKFDECQGTTANDSAGNSLTGTWNGTGGGTQTSAGDCNTTGTAWKNGATGKFNYSLNFDATDDYVSVTDTTGSILDISSNITLSAWIYANSWVNYAGIMSKAVTGRAYSFEVANTGALRFEGNGFSSFDSTTTMSTDVWNHVVLTYNGSTFRYYINGKPDNTSNQSGTFEINNDSLVIGADIGGTDEFFDGKIDDVRIYNYDLTATQIKTLFNQDSAVRYGPLTGSP